MYQEKIQSTDANFIILNILQISMI